MGARGAAATVGFGLPPSPLWAACWQQESWESAGTKSKLCKITSVTLHPAGAPCSVSSPAGPVSP